MAVEALRGPRGRVAYCGAEERVGGRDAQVYDFFFKVASGSLTQPTSCRSDRRTLITSWR